MRRLNANRAYAADVAYAVYLLLSALSAAGFALVFTVNLIYQAITVGLNPLQLVLVGTTLELTCFLCEIPTGVVADVYSRRLSVIIGYFLIGAGFLAEGLIPRFEGVLLAQMLWGLGWTFTSGATEAWIADEIGEAHAGRAYLRGSQVGAAAGLVATFASALLGGVQINLPILAGGLLFVLLAVTLILVMPENGFTPVPFEGRSSWQKMTGVFRSGVRIVRGRHMLMIILGVSLCYGLYSEGFDRLSTDHLLTNFTFPAIGHLQPVVWFGIMSAAARILGIAANEFVRRRIDLQSHRDVTRALFLVNGLLVLVLAGFGLVGSFAAVFAVGSAISVLRTVTDPVHLAWINQHVESSVRATVISMSSQLNALGQVVGGPIMGAIATALAAAAGLGAALRVTMILAAIILAPVLLLYARAIRQTIPSVRVQETA